MTSSTTVARSTHLQKASDALRVSSPALAAYLNHVRTVDTLKKNSHVKVDSESLCGACGNSLILGWSCTIPKTPGRRRTRNLSNPAATVKDYQTIKVRCERCNSHSEIVKKPKAKKSIKTLIAASSCVRSHEHPPVAATPAASKPPPQQGAVSSSSSRRARSKKSTLQSLLAEKKQTTVPVQKQKQFDLMDFVK